MDKPGVHTGTYSVHVCTCVQNFNYTDNVGRLSYRLESGVGFGSVTLASSTSFNTPLPITNAICTEIDTSHM